MKSHKKLIAAFAILTALVVVGTASATTYYEHTAITAPVINSHNPNDPVYAGQEYTLTCTPSTDTDKYYNSGNCTWYYPSDNVTLTWTGAGTFEAPGTGTSVTWIPPRASGNATVYVTADDTGSPNYYNSPSVNDSVTLIVQNTIYYVDIDATGNDDGSSWTDAFNYLQDALGAVSSGDEIWVAEGTYYPDDGTGHTAGDSDETFTLVDGVAIYGGFDGTETARSDRDWVDNVTTLSGDIDHDGVLDSDNSYHVVTGEDNATIDGFTITKGYGEGTSGGGMLIDHTSPIVANCVFTDNFAYSGGAMHSWGTHPTDITPTVTNCTFKRNYASSFGGAMSHLYSNPTITNCLFSENTASGYPGTCYDGGAMFCCMADMTLTNCTFVGNLAGEGILGGSSGAIEFVTSYPTITNCIFWGNTASWYGDEIVTVVYGDVTFTNCNIEGGWNGSKVYVGGGDQPSSVTDGGGNIDSDPCFVNIFDFADGTTAAGTTTTIYVDDASIYDVDDEIEYDNDGVARKVTNVNTTTDIVTFANDALDADSVKGKSVKNWGFGATDVDEDLHLSSSSDCIDAGDPNGTYTGQKDMDNQDRVNGSEVDIGADEYYSS